MIVHLTGESPLDPVARRQGHRVAMSPTASRAKGPSPLSWLADAVDTGAQPLPESRMRRAANQRRSSSNAGSGRRVGL
jgi:hypothetical protein